MQLTTKKSDKKDSPYYVKAFYGFFFMIIVEWLFPNAIPFDLWELWEIKATPIEWFTTASFFMIWGALLTVILTIVQLSKKSLLPKRLESPGHFKTGFITSIRAGVGEELAFRWILFYGAIVTAKVGNFILGGFMGYGLIELFHTHIVAPIADFTTLNYLHEILYHPASWAVGAAALATNAIFRDGHSYQGLLGWIDSWFFGMLMFYMAFEYGLLSCILIHFSYDMMIFILLAIMSLFQRKSTVHNY